MMVPAGKQRNVILEKGWGQMKKKKEKKSQWICHGQLGFQLQCMWLLLQIHEVHTLQLQLSHKEKEVCSHQLVLCLPFISLCNFIPARPPFISPPFSFFLNQLCGVGMQTQTNVQLRTML